MRDLRALSLTDGTHTDAFVALGGERCSLPPPPDDGHLTDLLYGAYHGLALDAFSRADCVILAAPRAESLVDAGHFLLEKLLPNAFPRDLRHFLVDQSAPGAEPTAAVLNMVQRLQGHGEVTAVFSPESLSVAAASLGIPAAEDPERCLARMRSDLRVGACLLIGASASAAASRPGSETIPPAQLPEGAGATCAQTMFCTAYCAAGLLGISPKHQLRLASAAVQTQLSTEASPSWVEIDRHIRKNVSEHV